MGDFNLQKLPLRRLQALWEQKNRVLLEEYYIFSVAVAVPAAATVPVPVAALAPVPALVPVPAPVPVAALVPVQC